MRKPSIRKTNLQGRIETLEPRVVMSADPLADLLGGAIVHHGFDDELPELVHHASGVDDLPSLVHHDTAPDSLPPLSQHVEDPVPDFWITKEDRALIESEFGRIEQMLSSAHVLTGWNTVNANYGFDGRGQTVAVIDSGIAYDHYALGGGYGANYRVVGGYDFTENDANPYDDGTAGSHGTHVAGIIGSSDSTHKGVASGVDLVGLRVFSDSGAGYFSWVEQALQWVHQNRNAFENPITAVNLSLGVSSWNSESIPAWANLEDEFAQLEADGIFIAVSAGNSFTSYNTTGLSYPAASPHVVPVMSVDDSGLLSYYSQRSTRAIAGPGRGITSTVPDYAGNNNSVADDWKGMSGTSMASPYIAGASTLIRQAMELVGMSGITQDAIYDHMMATADSFFDSATSTTFKRLNLQSAIDALIPDDDFGSSMIDAYNLGTMTSGTMNGMISTLSDADYFRFTAGATGSVSFNATSTTHDMVADWSVYSSSGAQMMAAQGETAAFNVVAGETYYVSLRSSDGLGYYSFDVSADAPAFTPEDWGTVTYNSHANQNIAGESWYLVTASQNGYLTTLANFSSGGGAVSLEVYDTQQNFIAAGTTGGTSARVDVNATAGQQFLLRIQGTNSDVDVWTTNLVNHVGTTVTVTGTAGADNVTFSGGSSLYVTINGIGYGFTPGEATSFVVNAGAGADQLVAYGGSGDDMATLTPSGITMSGTSYTLTASGLTSQTIVGGGGNDNAYLYDSAGSDHFSADATSGTLAGSSFVNTVTGFASVRAFSLNGGVDTATLTDTVGNDVFTATRDYATLVGNGQYRLASGFDSVTATASQGGTDTANLFDGLGDDVLTMTPTSASINGVGVNATANGFESVLAYASAGGNDQVNMFDSAGNNHFVTTGTYSRMTGAGFSNYAHNFEIVTATASAGGVDIAEVYDSTGNDAFVASPTSATFTIGSRTRTASGFDQVFAGAIMGGTDTAELHDGAGNDTLGATSIAVRLSGSGYSINAAWFDSTVTFADAGGYDTALLYDTAGNDYFQSAFGESTMSGVGYSNRAVGFDRVLGYATAGGNDVAHIFDSAFDDHLVATSGYMTMTGGGTYRLALGFDQASAVANAGGFDTAEMHDSVGDDFLDAAGSVARLYGSGFDNTADGFDDVTAYAVKGGTNDSTVAAVDYAFHSIGNWS